MRLTLHNLTNGPIYMSEKRSNPGEGLITLPAKSSVTRDSSIRSKIILIPRLLKHDSYGMLEKSSLDDCIIKAFARVTRPVSWQAVKVSERCSWRIYRVRISQNHHTLLIFPRRNNHAFLSDIPDTVPLSSLLLPGTHDTMAFYGWPISQCQSLDTPLSAQLQLGIRVIDIRLAVIKSRLVAYHGVYPQRALFQTILGTLYSFLTDPSSSQECIVMSIKQEDFASTPLSIFSKLVHQEIWSGPGGRDIWFLDNRIPTLGEVRGKIIMFSRFGGDGTGWEGGLEGLGIHPTAWPDSEKSGFTWECKNTLVRTHDWYNIPSFLAIPEKTALATQILLTPSNDPPVPSLAITYFSAASFPFAFPPTIAKGLGWPKWGLGVEGVNGRVGRWLLDLLCPKDSTVISDDDQTRKIDHEAGPRVRGWTFMDFCTDPDGLIPLLIECNFIGRQKGDEGW